MTDTLTITGKVATDPTQGQTSSGIPVTNFRLASTHRRFDTATQTWVDAGTNWYSVAAFRQLAAHAKASLRSGDSVIVTGRLKIRNWESNGKHGTSVDIDAESIGHDLRWGTSAYARALRPTTPAGQGQSSAASEDDGDLHETDPERAMALTDAVWTAPDDDALQSVADGMSSELADAEATPF